MKEVLRLPVLADVENLGGAARTPEVWGFSDVRSYNYMYPIQR